MWTETFRRPAKCTSPVATQCRRFVHICTYTRRTSANCSLPDDSVFVPQSIQQHLDHLLLHSEHTQRQRALGRVCGFVWCVRLDVPPPALRAHTETMCAQECVWICVVSEVTCTSFCAPSTHRGNGRLGVCVDLYPELLTRSSATSETSLLCSATNMSRTTHQLFRNLRVLNALLCCKFVQNSSPALLQPQSPQRFALL